MNGPVPGGPKHLVTEFWYTPAQQADDSLGVFIEGGSPGLAIADQPVAEMPLEVFGGTMLSRAIFESASCPLSVWRRERCTDSELVSLW